METRAGVRELKSRLDEYLRLVKAGQTIAITERGKVIGYLSPVAFSVEEKMKDLETAGFLRRGRGTIRLRQPVIVNSGTKQVSDLVIEDRR